MKTLPISLVAAFGLLSASTMVVTGAPEADRPDPAHVQLLALDPVGSLDLVQRGLPLELPFAGDVYSLVLVSQPILAPDAQLMGLDGSGQPVVLPNLAHTFSGKVMGRPDLDAAITITPDWIGGAILGSGLAVFIEEAAAFADDPWMAAQLASHQASGAIDVLHVLYDDPNELTAVNRQAAAEQAASQQDAEGEASEPAASGENESNVYIATLAMQPLCDEVEYQLQQLQVYIAPGVVPDLPVAPPGPIPTIPAIVETAGNDAVDLVGQAYGDTAGKNVDRATYAYLGDWSGYAFEEARPGYVDPQESSYRQFCATYVGGGLPPVEDPTNTTPSLLQPVMDRITPYVAVPSPGTWTDIRKITIGVMVDQYYVNYFGGMTWTGHAQKLFNTMNTIYLRDAGLRVQVSGMAVSSSLNSQNWDTVFANLRQPSQTAGENVVHALLGKDMDSEVIGLAPGGCPTKRSGSQHRPDILHGFSKPSSDHERTYVIMHEIGHNMYKSAGGCGHQDAKWWTHWHGPVPHSHYTLMEHSAWQYHVHEFSTKEREAIRKGAVEFHKAPVA